MLIIILLSFIYFNVAITQQQLDPCPTMIEIGQKRISCFPNPIHNGIFIKQDPSLSNDIILITYGELGSFGLWNITDGNLIQYFDQEITTNEIIQVFYLQEMNQNWSDKEDYFIIVDYLGNVFEYEWKMRKNPQLIFEISPFEFEISRNIYCVDKDRLIIISQQQDQSIKSFQRINGNSIVKSLDGINLTIQCTISDSDKNFYFLNSNNLVYQYNPDLDLTKIIFDSKIESGSTEVISKLYKIDDTKQDVILSIKNETNYLIYKIQEPIPNLIMNITTISQFIIAGIASFNDNDNQLNYIIYGSAGQIYINGQLIDLFEIEIIDQRDSIIDVLDKKQLILSQNFTFLINQPNDGKERNYLYFFSENLIIVYSITDQKVNLIKYISDRNFIESKIQGIVQNGILKFYYNYGLIFMEIDTGNILLDTMCQDSKMFYGNVVKYHYLDSDYNRFYFITEAGELSYFNYPSGKTEVYKQYYTGQMEWLICKQLNRIFLWKSAQPSDILYVVQYSDGQLIAIIDGKQDSVNQVFCQDTLNYGYYFYKNAQEALLIIDIKTNNLIQKMNVVQIKNEIVEKLNCLEEGCIIFLTNSILFIDFNNAYTIRKIASSSTLKGKLSQLILNKYKILFIEDSKLKIATSFAYPSNKLDIYIGATLPSTLSLSQSFLQDEDIYFLASTQVVSIYANSYSAFSQVTGLSASPRFASFDSINKLLIITTKQIISIIKYNPLTLLKSMQVLSGWMIIKNTFIDPYLNIFVVLFQYTCFQVYDYKSYQFLSEFCNTNSPIYMAIDTKQKFVIYYNIKSEIMYIKYEVSQLKNTITVGKQVYGGAIQEQRNILIAFTDIITFYNYSTYQPILFSQKLHNSPISTFKIIEKWNTILTSSNESFINIWDYTTLIIIQTLNHQSYNGCKISIFTFYAGKVDWIIAGCNNGGVIIWSFNISTKLFEYVNFIKLFSESINDIEIWEEIDQIFISSVSSCKRIKFNTLPKQPQIQISEWKLVNFSLDKVNGIITYTNIDGRVFVVDAFTQEIYLERQTHVGQILQILCDPIQKGVITIGSDSDLSFSGYYDKTTFPRTQFTINSQPTTVILDNEANIFIAANISNQIRIFQYPNFKLLRQLTNHSGVVNMIIIDVKRNLLITCSNDSTIMIWDYQYLFNHEFVNKIRKESLVSYYEFNLKTQITYFVTTDSYFKKWDMNSQQFYQGQRIKNSDFVEGKIFSQFLNDQLLIRASLETIKIFNQTSLYQTQVIEQPCLDPIMIQYFLFCKVNQFVIQFSLDHNSGLIQQIKNTTFPAMVSAIQENLIGSNSLIIILSTYEINIYDYSQDKVLYSSTKTIPEFIISIQFQPDRIYIQSYSGLLLVIRKQDIDIYIQEKILNHNTRTSQLYVDENYIMVYQIKNSNLNIYHNNQNNSTYSLYGLIKILGTPSNMINLDITVSMQLDRIVLSNDYHYFLFTYSDLKYLSRIKSLTIFLPQTFTREVNILSDQIIFIQQQTTFFLLQYDGTEQLKLQASIPNIENFGGNIFFRKKVNDQGHIAIEAAYKNVYGISYFNFQVTGNGECKIQFDKYDPLIYNQKVQMLEKIQKQNKQIYNIDTFYFYIPINQNQSLHQLPTFQFSNITSIKFYTDLKNILIDIPQLMVNPAISYHSIAFSNFTLIRFVSQNTFFKNIQMLSMQESSLQLNEDQQLHLADIQHILFNNLKLQNFNLNQKQAFQISGFSTFQLTGSQIEKLNLFNSTLFYIRQDLLLNKNSTVIIRSNQVFKNQLKFSQMILIEAASNFVSINNTISENNCDQSILYHGSYLLTVQTSFELFSYNLNLVYMKYENFIQFTDDALYTYFKSQLDQVTLQYVTLEHNTLLEGRLIEIITQSLSLDQITLNENLSRNLELLFISSDNIILNSSVFIQNQNTNKTIIFIQNSKQIQISDCKFQINKGKDSGVLYFENVSKVDIKSSQFQNNTSIQNGGALVIKNNPQFSITSCIFYYNQAKGSGGSIFIISSDGEVKDSQFLYNTASIGGAIRYQEIKPKFLMNINRRQESPYLDSCRTSSNNTCLSNKASLYGQNIASYPEYISINGIQQTKNIPYILDNVQSGSSNSSIVIQLHDEEGFTISDKFLNETTEDIINEFTSFQAGFNIENINQEISNQNFRLEGVLTVAFYNSSFSLEKYITSGIPSQQFTTSIFVKGIREINGSNNVLSRNFSHLIIYIFRKCLVGEVRKKLCSTCKIVSCVDCNYGTYSMQDPEAFQDDQLECKKCIMDGAGLCYKEKIEIIPGYWRKEESSDEIIKCNIEENCYGPASKGYCQKGNIGPLCETCDLYGVQWDEKYMPISYLRGQCVECTQSKSQIIYLASIYCMIIVYLTILSLVANKNSILLSQCTIMNRIGFINLGITGQVGVSSMYNKLLIHHLQIISSLLKNIPNFKVTLIDLIGFQTNPFFSPMETYQFSFDCLMTNYKIFLPLPFMRVMLVQILSLVSFPLLFLFYFIYVIILRCKLKLCYQYLKSYYFGKAFYNIFLCTFFFLQQSVVTCLANTMSCRKIGSEYYQNSYLLEECFTNNHIQNLLFITLPLILIWIIIIPLLLVFKARNFSKNYNNYSYQRKYGFLFQGYKKDRHHWEILKIYLRMIVVFITQMLQDHTQQRNLLIMFLLLVYVALLEKQRPYSRVQFNDLDSTISKCCIFILWFALQNANLDNIYATLVLQFFITYFVFRSILIVLASFLNYKWPVFQDKLLQMRCVQKIRTLSKKFSSQGVFLQRYIPFLYKLLYSNLQNSSCERFRRFALVRRAVKTYILQNKLERRKSIVQSHFYDCINSQQLNLTKSKNKNFELKSQFSNKFYNQNVTRRSLNQNQDSPISIKDQETSVNETHQNLISKRHIRLLSNNDRNIQNKQEYSQHQVRVKEFIGISSEHNTPKEEIKQIYKQKDYKQEYSQHQDCVSESIDIFSEYNSPKEEIKQIYKQKDLSDKNKIQLEQTLSIQTSHN